MHIPPSVSPRTASVTGAVLSLFLLVVVASPGAARPDWVQSVPPEVVLGFQPRTWEEAMRPPRPRATLPSLLAQAAPAAPLAASDGPGAVWTAWAPPGLCYHSLVHDSRRGVFYIVGGLSTLDPQGLVWRYEPDQGECTPIAMRPGGGEASFAGAVYDSLRDQLLVASLSEGTLVLDALALPGLGWSRLWSSWVHGNFWGQPRPAGMAIDTRRDQLTLLGLWDSDSLAQRIVRIPLSDPEAWATSWSRGPGLPPIAHNGSAVYDETRDRFFVVFDENWNDMYPGMDHNSSSLWSVNAEGAPQWLAQPLGAAWGEGFPRDLARDRLADRLLVVDEFAGAWSVSPDDGSAQRLDNGNAGPGAGYVDRFGIAAAFDATTRRFHVHGGQQLGQGLPMFMSLSVDGADAPPPGTIPWSTDGPEALGSRWGHALLLDPVSNQLVSISGETVPWSDTSTTAVHPLSASVGWRHIDPPGQPQGRHHFASSLVLDRARHAVLAFGGVRYDGGDLPPTLDGDLWSLSLEGGATWEVVGTVGPRPPARRYAQFFFDLPNNRFILTGGDDWQGYLTDAWELRMEPVPTWRELGLSGELPSPYSPIYPDEWRGGAWLVRWGVLDGVFWPVYHMTLGADSILIARVPTLGEAPSLDMRGFCFDPAGQRLVGFMEPFGYDDVFFSRLYEVKLGSAAVWNQLPTSGVPPADRGAISTAFDPGGNRMLMVGGYDDNQHYCGDTWQLQFLDYATPVALSLASATTDADGVHLRWRTGAAVTTAAVERSRDGTAWEPVGNAYESGAEELAFDDRSLAAGESAAYRLRLLAGSEVIVSEPVWVTAVSGAPVALSLRALARPAGAAPSVLLSASSGEEARLSLLDVSGRRLEDVHVAGGTRTHTFSNRPAPGLYFAELAQGGERRVARIVVTP